MTFIEMILMLLAGGFSPVPGGAGPNDPVPLPAPDPDEEDEEEQKKEEDPDPPTLAEILKKQAQKKISNGF